MMIFLGVNQSRNIQTAGGRCFQWIARDDNNKDTSDELRSIIEDLKNSNVVKSSTELKSKVAAISTNLAALQTKVDNLTNMITSLVQKRQNKSDRKLVAKEKNPTLEVDMQLNNVKATVKGRMTL